MSPGSGDPTPTDRGPPRGGSPTSTALLVLSWQKLLPDFLSEGSQLTMVILFGVLGAGVSVAQTLPPGRRRSNSGPAAWRACDLDAAEHRRSRCARRVCRATCG
jgi:hypothetical protein